MKKKKRITNYKYQNQRTSMKKTILTFASIFLISLTMLAQNTIHFTLEEAINHGLLYNTTVKNALSDIEIAQKKVHETTAIGLPQVNAKISNTNYLNIATTLMPDFITPAVFAVNEDNFGLTATTPQGDAQFFPVSFGTKFNASAEITVSQLIFNGSYLVGLQAAKAYLEQSRVQSEKSRIDIKELVTSAYYLVLVTQKNKSILDSTLSSLRSIYTETKEIHKQGFIEDTEVDQIELMIADLETNLLYVTNQIKLSKSYLKVLLGVDYNSEIYLTDELDNLLNLIQNPTLLTSDFQFSKNIDYRIMENQKELSKLSLKNEKANSLPVISAFFTAQANAMRDSYDFFDGGKPWYPTTLWGIQMDIPLFSSGSRSSKVKQAKLELKKIEELEIQLKNNLNTAEENTKTNFRNALLINQNKQNAVKLANRIYHKTQLKYKEGVSSSLDLLQAYNQYLETEGSYITSIVDLVNTKLALEKLFSE